MKNENSHYIIPIFINRIGSLLSRLCPNYLRSTIRVLNFHNSSRHLCTHRQSHITLSRTQPPIFRSTSASNSFNVNFHKRSYNYRFLCFHKTTKPISVYFFSSYHRCQSYILPLTYLFLILSSLVTFHNKSNL